MERLSGLDAMFLYLETPTVHMHAAWTSILDPSTMAGGYEFGKIQDFVGSRLHLVPLFRRRIVEVPFAIEHPIWVDEPKVDLDYHIRRIGAPSPGGHAELAEVAAQITSVPLDRSRPLWEMHVIEGLAGGKVGVVVKLHHCGIDGGSGVEMMGNLFDSDPIGRELNPPAPQAPEPIPSPGQVLRQAIGPRARRVAGIIPLLGSTSKSVRASMARRRDPDAGAGPEAVKAPPTRWNDPISAHRRTSFTRVELEDLMVIKRRVGCTFNDVVMALVAGTLRRYLEAHDALPDMPLIAVCPVNVRSDSERGQMNNKLSAIRTSLATDVEDPVDRLRTIIEVTNAAKAAHRARGPKLFESWAEHVGPTSIALGTRLSAVQSKRRGPVVNVAISNAPGPRSLLYFAGAKIECMLPMGPIADGVGLNITVLTYMGSADVGFLGCREQIPDIWSMTDCFHEALDELATATSKLEA